MRTATWASAATITSASRNAHTPAPRRWLTSVRTIAFISNRSACVHLHIASRALRSHPLRCPQPRRPSAWVARPLVVRGHHDVFRQQAQARRVFGDHGAVLAGERPQPPFDDSVLERVERDDAQPPARPQTARGNVEKTVELA